MRPCRIPHRIMTDVLRSEKRAPMLHALLAGASYFISVFAIGFALGTVRVLLLVPQFGELASGLIELPIILGMSWWACGNVIRIMGVPPVTSDRLIMGASAFLLLMIAELILSMVLFDRTLPEHMAHYTTVHGALGLAGQFLFAAFPLMMMRRQANS